MAPIENTFRKYCREKKYKELQIYTVEQLKLQTNEVAKVAESAKQQTAKLSEEMLDRIKSGELRIFRYIKE